MVAGAASSHGSVNPSSTLKSIPWEDESRINSEDESKIETEFEKMFSSEEAELIKEGKIVKGTVARLTDDYVVIDIGHKSEGEVAKAEFRSPETGELEVKVGEEVEVFLEAFEDQDGEMVLSREKALILRAWDNIEAAFEAEKWVEGTVVARVKGGLSVDIGVKAFLPGSQIDLRPVRNLDRFLGTKHKFKIIKFNKKRGNIVLSRRAILEQDREKMRSSTLENLQEGLTIKGAIKNITDYGAFVDLGGIDGLLHITDMSWGRINHPSQIFEVGQEIEVKVLNYDQERSRVSLGYKQLHDDPWMKAMEKYVDGSRWKGKIVSLTDYGAFVELEEGIEGLIHVSEMSWSKRVRHPSKIVQLGEEVEVIVLSVDKEQRRISLGMKQIEPNPWELVQSKYQMGDIIRGKIRNVTDFGIFIGIEDGIDGLIHVSDISWTEKIEHPAEKFKKGDEIDAKILQIDPENERFSLGIKQLEEDPWFKVAGEFKSGTKAKGKVTKIADFGVFVQLAPGVDGMIHASELSENPDEKPSQVCKVDDEVEFIVLSTDPEARKFSLSRLAVIKNLQGDDLKEYISKIEPQTSMAAAFEAASQKNDEQ